jgi:methyl-accepting chemotaxis protein
MDHEEHETRSQDRRRVWSCHRLDQETVPEVTVANSIERSALETMYNMRGYSLTQNQEFFTLAKESLAEVKTSLGQAQRLAAKYPRLFALKKNVAQPRRKWKSTAG